jgi:hypothetical protein
MSNNWVSINGAVKTNLSADEFDEKFLEWVVSNGWEFLGITEPSSMDMDEIQDEGLKHMVFAFEDDGDQEGRLTSINMPKLIIPESNEVLEDVIKNGEYPEPEHFAESIMRVDRLITISNEFYDEDNLKREVMIDGKEKNDVIHGFKFANSGLMSKLGYTIVINRVDHDEMGRIWYTKKSYDETLELLRGIPVNPVAKYENMYWDTNLIPEDDGNMEIYNKFLEDSPEFERIETVMFYDNLNGEWFFVDKGDDE